MWSSSLLFCAGVAGVGSSWNNGFFTSISPVFVKKKYIYIYIRDIYTKHIYISLWLKNEKNETKLSQIWYDIKREKFQKYILLSYK